LQGHEFFCLDARQMKNLIQVPSDTIISRIFYIRGKKVMFDSDLAKLYEVATKNLNKAVNRNKDRFPSDFCFRLNDQEASSSRFQFGTSSYGRIEILSENKRFLNLFFICN
jgi:hypothetical protein